MLPDATAAWMASEPRARTTRSGGGDSFDSSSWSTHSHTAVGTDQAEWEWVLHELLSNESPPPDRVILALGPDAIRAAVAAGNTIAYSALTPDDVGLPARCVATRASAPCIAPDDRERYPLLVPMWFAATSATLANELVTAMLQPDIVAASASGGVVIEGEPRAESEVSPVPTG